MAPANAPETLRKALAMGAAPRRPRHRPGARRARARSRPRPVLAAALATLEFDLVLAGVDTSDGVGGVVAGRRRGALGLPFLSYAARIEPDPAAGTVRVRRISADRLRPARGADAGASSPAPRRSASRATRRSRGSWPPARKEIVTRSLADLGLDAAAVGGAVATTARPRRRDAAGPRPRRGSSARRPTRPRRQVVDFLAERRII